MVFVSSNARQILEKYQRRIANLTRFVGGIEQSEADRIKQIAIRFSSGTYQSAWLAQQARLRGAGLYAVADPAPPADPSIINAQSGALRSGWQLTIRRTGDGTETDIRNSVPYFDYLLHGTSKMIARPIIEAILKQSRLERTSRLHSATEQAMKG